MAEIEILPQKIVNKRTIILKSRLDSNKVRLQGERIKTSFFAKFGFLKPKSEEIVLVAFSKYYEPYIVIGGKYAIDYCRRQKYTIKVEDKTQAFFIDGKELKPEPISPEDNVRMIKLVGEEHSHYENETYLILDRMRQEVSSDNLFFAPFENKYEMESVEDFDLKKPQISIEEEIGFLRSRVAKRPADVAEIIRENFEINERTTIYSPVYELTYKNMKNSNTVTAMVNGITGGLILSKYNMNKSKRFSDPSVSENHAMQKQFFQVAAERSHTHDNIFAPVSPVERLTKKLIFDEKGDNIMANPQIITGALRSNTKNDKSLETDLMARLGIKHSRNPKKIFVEDETEEIELQLQRGTS